MGEKMFFIKIKKGMGGKGVLKKRKRGRKRPPKFANSKTDGRLGEIRKILKAGETLFKKLPDYPRRSHNVNKSE